MCRYEPHVALGIISCNARACCRGLRRRRRWNVNDVDTSCAGARADDEHWASECYSGTDSIDDPIFNPNTDCDRYPDCDADCDTDARCYYNARTNRNADALTAIIRSPAAPGSVPESTLPRAASRGRRYRAGRNAHPGICSGPRVR
jgi:hypothetical protein